MSDPRAVSGDLTEVTIEDLLWAAREFDSKITHVLMPVEIQPGERVVFERSLDGKLSVTREVVAGVEYCGNCDMPMPKGCEGTFAYQPACRLHPVVVDEFEPPQDHPGTCGSEPWPENAP